MKNNLLVNIKYTNNYDVYIGRPSIYGNPYHLGKHGNRKEVINKYRIYFYKKLELDDIFRQQVLNLRGKILGCHCSPLECHGDVILEWLDYYGLINI